MKLSTLFIAALSLSNLGTAWGIDEGGKVQLDKNAPIASDIVLPSLATQSPRVRIPVQLTGYEKVVATDSLGRARMAPKALTPMKHHLRARIERPNHFYVGNWHIESIPQQWQKKDRSYSVKLRFFKRYGESKDLEEQVGTLDVKGRLVGEKDLFLFQGRQVASFTDKDGIKVLDVGVGPEVAKDERLSKADAGKKNVR